MILLVLASLLVIAFFYSSKVFVHALMVFFVLFDMLDGFYQDKQIFAAIRYLLPFFLILFFLFRKSALMKSDRLLFIVFLFLLVLLAYSSGDIAVSAKHVLAVFITLLMIPAGRHVGSTANFLDEFESVNRFLLVALPLYIGIANVLGFGHSYTDAFTTGFLVTSRMYIVPIIVFMAIHYAISNRNKRPLAQSVDLVFIVINIGIMIINTRRTTLLMLVAALLVYAFFNRTLIFKMVIISLFMIAALVLSYPLYEKPLSTQLEKRERIRDFESYEEEGRYLETGYILHYHSQEQHLAEILFGVKLFDTYDFGSRYFGKDRPIHSDLNMIFYSTGLTGVALFTLLFVHYFVRSNSAISPSNRSVYYSLLIMFLIVLIPGRFIGTMTYAPLLMFLLAAVKAGKDAPAVLDEMEEDERVMDIPNMNYKR